MLISPTQTRKVLETLSHSPNKRLGQNFLIDGNIVQKSVEMADIASTDHIVEIGPGLGTLTATLLNQGANVWAIERDRTLAEHIRAQLLPEHPHSLHLLEGDCLEHPRAGFSKTQAQKGFKIVANLPYAVSTPWMEAILSGPLPERMVLMLQKEAAQRYIAVHGSKAFGAISIFLQSAYSVGNKHFVPAQCFYPVPKVDSLLVQFDLRDNKVVFSEPIRSCIRQIFTQRRKQLGAFCKNGTHPEIDAWFKNIIESGVKATIRPEELPIEYWQHLANHSV